MSLVYFPSCQLLLTVSLSDYTHFLLNIPDFCVESHLIATFGRIELLLITASLSLHSWIVCTISSRRWYHSWLGWLCVTSVNLATLILSFKLTADVISVRSCFLIWSWAVIIVVIDEPCMTFSLHLFFVIVAVLRSDLSNARVGPISFLSSCTLRVHDVIFISISH